MGEASRFQRPQEQLRLGILQAVAGLPENILKLKFSDLKHKISVLLHNKIQQNVCLLCGGRDSLLSLQSPQCQ